VISAQYSLDTNEADVAATRYYLGQVSSPAILIGSSHGGAVITAAGTDDRAGGLVHIAALGRTPTRPPRDCRTSSQDRSARQDQGQRLQWQLCRTRTFVGVTCSWLRWTDTFRRRILVLAPS
jgi:hypothetical protein